MNITIVNIEPKDRLDELGICEKPDVAVLPEQDEPSVSVIVPHKCGEPLNRFYIESNDEYIVVRGGRCIGEARLYGAKLAKNDWIVQIDGDGYYPYDYIIKVKDNIRAYGDTYPVMCARRVGGFGHFFWPVIESGLIVRKDIFIERTSYVENTSRTWSLSGGNRADIGTKFTDAKAVDVYYYHPLTKGENMLLLSLPLIGITSYLWLKHAQKPTQNRLSHLR